jgi:hypothetical protein
MQCMAYLTVGSEGGGELGRIAGDETSAKHPFLR